MRLRPPITVWRFVTIELWRLLLLTTWVFVSVIAFAATIRPLADGKLGPMDAVKFMTLAIPPMLQYALPFAAGFGATLAYHRLATDNEVTACHAGGVSHRMLLLPALSTGIVLSIVLFILSNSVIPRFLRSMEELITVDATRLLVNTINRGDPVRLGDTLIYADLVRTLDVPPDSKALRVLYLQGVLVVGLDHEGEVSWEGSSREAKVFLYKGGAGQTDTPESRQGATTVVIKPSDLRARSKQEWGSTRQSTIVRTIPNAFSDNPKFLTWSELEHLRARPAEMDWIDRARRQLAARLAQRRVVASLTRSLHESHAVRFVDSQGRTVLLRAGALGPFTNEGHALEPVKPGGPVLVELLMPDGVSYTHRAAEAHLHAIAQSNTPDDPVRIRLILEDLTTTQTGADPRLAGEGIESGRQPKMEYDRLSMTDDPGSGLMDETTGALSARAERLLAADPGDEYVRGSYDHLRRQVKDLMREITSKEQERVVMSVTCLVMVLTGAVMALRLKDSVPLVVYMWSFFPALGAVLCVSAGQRAMHDYGLAGLPIIWGGAAVLTAYTAFEFRRLSRH